MLKKQYIKSKNVTRITFELAKSELPAESAAVEDVHLVGEFNDWEATATPMKRNKKGIYRATLELEPERPYQFRYLVNGERWCNDRAADTYAPNPYGSDNCVVFTGIEKTDHIQA
jgi:1,4-alpha-glucan branching enzyme